MKKSSNWLHFDLILNFLSFCVYTSTACILFLRLVSSKPAQFDASADRSKLECSAAARQCKHIRLMGAILKVLEEDAAAERRFSVRAIIDVDVAVSCGKISYENSLYISID